MKHNLLASKQLENCTFVKTVLMLLVILYHSCAFWTGSWFPAMEQAKMAPVLGLFAQWLNSFHVYTFALVSGYLFSYLKYEKRKYESLALFVGNKAKRLLVPYVTVSIVWAIPVGQYFYHYGAGEIITRYALATSPSQLWFLMMLFWCFIGAWLLSRAIENNSVLAIVIAIGSFGIGFIGGLHIPNYFCIWTAFQFFPYFVLGMKLRQGTWSLLERIPIWMYAACDAVIFAVWIILQSNNSTIIKLIGIGFGFLLHIVGALSRSFNGLVRRSAGRSARYLSDLPVIPCLCTCSTSR